MFDYFFGGVVLQFFRELHFIEAHCPLCGTELDYSLQFFRELHFIEALRRCEPVEQDAPRCSSFESCTSLRQPRHAQRRHTQRRCSSFESCTSLRHREGGGEVEGGGLQFFRELHFIEARTAPRDVETVSPLQFFRELHFIEAPHHALGGPREGCCSSFESCTSLRRCPITPGDEGDDVAVLSRAALH